jgi:hypothetical protein
MFFKFSLYKSFVSLLKLILFGAIINGIVFIISFSSGMLLVHRDTTDFVLWLSVLLSC